MSSGGCIDHEEIGVVPYSTEWRGRFQREKKRVAAVLPPSCEIVHIGSTAVPGLAAKPIVDIAARVEDIAIIESVIPPLKVLSYCYLGEFVSSDWHYFYRGNPREFNLHIVDHGTTYWESWIAFRDFLRANADVREEYRALKTGLAERYHNDRAKYTEGKSQFVASVLDRAKEMMGER